MLVNARKTPPKIIDDLFESEYNLLSTLGAHMFTHPFTFSVPVEVHPCSWEGELIENQHLVVVKCRRTDSTPRGKVGFVLNDRDIHDGRINVRKIAQSRTSAVVEPIAEYVPHLWGLVGIPPRQFRVPADSLRPE